LLVGLQGRGLVEDVLDAVRRGREPGTGAGRAGGRRRLALGHGGEGGERAALRRPATVPQVEQHLLAVCTLAEIHNRESAAEGAMRRRQRRRRRRRRPAPLSRGERRRPRPPPIGAPPQEGENMAIEC
jgi:hypothetical protein